MVKAFNHIFARHLAARGTPKGAAHRHAAHRHAPAIAGDDPAAKETVASFIDDLGLDVVDLGPLAEGWRLQRDTPGYTADLEADRLRRAAAEARRYRESG